MSDYADWQGIDRGHEWYWHRPTWIGVLTALNECGGSADFSNRNSIIYAKFKELTPQFPGFSIKNGEWRSDFRDGREPWVGTGVISFDDSQMKLTENGKLLLSGQKKYNEIFFETIRNYSENGENPFAVLADVFLSLPIYQGLSIDDAVKIMRHYRPSKNDDLKSTLLGKVEEISTTNKRRLRHILRLLTFTGGIVLDTDDIYYVSSKEILKSLCKNNSLSPEQTKKQFILWLKDNCKGTESFRDDMVKIIESWLDQRMPNDNIGNLFRFSKTSEYEQEKARITNLPLFESVNRGNQNGRPKTALNHYTNFLAYLNSLEGGQESSESASNNPSRPFTPSQIIYYGVPGCGKSHEIKKKLKNVPDYNKIRTVFHPEYCNADFVGQILPEVNINADGRSIVEYKFKPGPFTEIVRRAYLNPDENFYLAIEEINRGNAAAIFGEMFQLLDRLDADENADEVSSEHIYGKGWSSYGVDNQDVNAYIRNQVVISQEKPEHCSNVTGSAGDLNPRLYKSMDIESENVAVTWREKNENGFTPKSKHIHFTANTAIRLPPNLSIYATMNTSDQNVFTLDNAFQRRWEMKQIPNDLKNTGNSAAQYCRTIKKVKKTESREETVDTNVQWGDFRKAINEVIMDSAQANGLSSMEDKRLGGWFYTESDNFAEKVLKYLWDDAFKFDRPNQFNDVTTLEELVEKFNGDDGFNVFKDGRISELQKDSLTTPDTPAQNDTSVTNG